MDHSKSVAELAAMRARGEISATEFEAAKRLLTGSDVSNERSPPPRQTAPHRRRNGCRTAILWFLVILGGLWALGAWVQANKTPEQRAREAEARAERTAMKKAEEMNKAAENKRKGFHCLSGWDGSHRGLVESVKASLRDPSSFEHIETRITPVDKESQHTIILKYRAKNGFGGMNVELATGVIDSASCHLIGRR